MPGVLDGVRVLDFGRYIAGPYCAALLADHGAEVIRIEKREGSEDRYQVPIAATGEGGLFLQMNRNKRGMTLDPMTGAGRAIVRELVATADIVVANLPPQTLASMGLDYDSLKAVKPDIILTTVSAFGEGGPYSDRVGFDSIGQVMSGGVYMTGEVGQPYRCYLPWVDFTTALHAAFGTMAALIAKHRTGQGQRVETALLAAAVTVSNGLLIEQDAVQADRVPTGNRGQTAGPVDIFATTDGWIVVHVVGTPLYKRWARLMGEPEWLSDPRFVDDISRGANGAVISERMARWCAGRSTAEALETLAEARIPAGPLLTPQQVLDDPHVQAMGFLQRVDFPGLPKPAPIARAPVWLSATPGAIAQRAPMLGEHTDEILAELGYDAAAIAALRADGVI